MSEINFVFTREHILLKSAHMEWCTRRLAILYGTRSTKLKAVITIVDSRTIYHKCKHSICICRRKPQNLTPPLSSDGGSGQSPSSTHNGSPPPAVKRPSLNNDKYSSDGGPTSKKQRISHFKKDVVNNDNNRLDFNSCVQLQCDNLKFLNRRRNVLDSRDSANLNPRSREYDGIPMRSSSHYG